MVPHVLVFFRFPTFRSHHTVFFWNPNLHFLITRHFLLGLDAIYISSYVDRLLSAETFFSITGMSLCWEGGKVKTRRKDAKCTTIRAIPTEIEMIVPRGPPNLSFQVRNRKHLDIPISRGSHLCRRQSLLLSW